MGLKPSSRSNQIWLQKPDWQKKILAKRLSKCVRGFTNFSEANLK